VASRHESLLLSSAVKLRPLGRAPMPQLSLDGFLAGNTSAAARSSPSRTPLRSTTREAEDGGSWLKPHPGRSVDRADAHKDDDLAETLGSHDVEPDGDERRLEPVAVDIGSSSSSSAASLSRAAKGKQRAGSPAWPSASEGAESHSALPSSDEEEPAPARRPTRATRKGDYLPPDSDSSDPSAGSSSDSEANFVDDTEPPIDDDADFAVSEKQTEASTSVRKLRERPRPSAAGLEALRSMRAMRASSVARHMMSSVHRLHRITALAPSRC
jgi:hypothetical protein